MSEEKNYTSMDQNEFMKRMKAIASDLWGGIVPAEEEKQAPAVQKDNAPAASEKMKTGIQNIWKTADETIDWTDALAHSTPTDGLTGPRMWTFYHKNVFLDTEKVVYPKILIANTKKFPIRLPLNKDEILGLVNRLLKIKYDNPSNDTSSLEARQSGR